MGAIGGPDITTPTATSTGGNDDFGGRPVDVVFKYAGVNGNGDPGVIDPPTNAYRMTQDFDALSAINQHPTRVAMVEYTAQMSGGLSFDDFTNGPAGLSSANPAATYLIDRYEMDDSAAPSAATIAVGNYALSCGAAAYNCLSPNDTYRDYLLEYGGVPNHYNWNSGNGKLALAASDDVFAILWGGGNTTNVIRNFSNIDDHGWLVW